MLLRIIFFFLYLFKDVLIWMKRFIFGGSSKNDTYETVPKLAKSSGEGIAQSSETNVVGEKEKVVEENVPRLSIERKEPIFGKTLADFGYAFNEKGELRNIDTGEKFIYEVKPGDKVFNQAHYEALGKVIDGVIYDLLEKECNLKRIIVPHDADDDEPKSFYFESENAKNDENLMIIIHGSGVVRAGQWARRLIINDSLETGTQMPYIKKAATLGMGVIVLNTNENRAVDKIGHERLIRNSDSSLAHTCYVWDQIMRLYKAKNVAIVAHSAGGWDTVKLFSLKDFGQLKRIFAVCFTDSVHIMPRESRERLGMNHLRKVARNWICSSEPLDTPISRSSSDIICFSAGTTTHELSSHCAIECIFKYVSEKLTERLSEKDDVLIEKQEASKAVVDKNRDGHVSHNSLSREIINGDSEKSKGVAEPRMDVVSTESELVVLNGKTENAQMEVISKEEPLPLNEKLSETQPLSVGGTKTEPTEHRDDFKIVDIFENGTSREVEGIILQ